MYKLQLGVFVTNGTSSGIQVSTLFGTEGTGGLITISQKGSFFQGEDVTISKYYVTQVGSPLTDGSPVASGGSDTLASYRTAYFVLDIYAPSYPLCYNYTTNIPAVPDDKKSAPFTFTFGNSNPNIIVRGAPDASTLWLTVNPPYQG